VERAPARSGSIWLWALGYFAAYAPYSLLTKALSDGHLGAPVSGNTILPLSTFSSLLAMVAFLLGTGWWRSAGTRTVLGRQVPFPTRWTALSGLCGATILTTTTLAYTIDGVSIVFMMLLMRGGVLAMAPLVDALSGRAVPWPSRVALALTLASLLVALLERQQSLALPALAVADVVAYLLAYFVRLRFMSKLAKTDSPEVTRRYFVEEQLVSTPAALLALGVLALVGTGALGGIRAGFTQLPFSSQAPWAVVIGVLSQGTGIFGALVLLDKRENSFSVPVNRASSVLAGVLATVVLAALDFGKRLDWHEAVGAALVLAAIAVLSVPGLLAARRASAR
jgi:drug/metabolite transporter (DMT)-like permease